jgi:hypothetical protein
MSGFNKLSVLFLIATISCTNKPMELAAPRNTPKTLENCPEELSQLLYSPNGAFIVGHRASSGPMKLRIWNGMDGKEIWTSYNWQVKRNLNDICNIAIDPQSTSVAVVGSLGRENMPGYLAALDIATGKEKFFVSYADKGNRTNCVSYNRDGKQLALGISQWWSKDNNILKIMESATGNIIQEKALPGRTVNALAYSSDGKLLGVAIGVYNSDGGFKEDHTAATQNYQFILLDLTIDKIITEFYLTEPADSIDFLDNKIIITSRNECIIADTQSNEKIFISPGNDFWFSQACLLKTKQLLLGKMPAEWENKGPENARYVNMIDILTGNIVTSWGKRPVSAMAADPNTDETIIITSSKYHKPVRTFNPLNRN